MHEDITLAEADLLAAIFAKAQGEAA